MGGMVVETQLLELEVILSQRHPTLQSTTRTGSRPSSSRRWRTATARRWGSGSRSRGRRTPSRRSPRRCCSTWKVPFVALCSDLLTRINEQVEAEEYLAVFFTGPCEERAKTDQVGSTGTASAHCPNVACEILMFQFWNTYWCRGLPIPGVWVAEVDSFAGFCGVDSFFLEESTPSKTCV